MKKHDRPPELSQKCKKKSKVALINTKLQSCMINGDKSSKLNGK